MLEVLDATRHYATGKEELEVFIAHFTALKIRALQHGVNLPGIGEVEEGSSTVTYARVNHNRWIADCQDCNGAELVFLGYPFFMCQNCWNGVIYHKWRKIIIPENYRLIEQVLKHRPIPANRNWNINEDIITLCNENEDHNLPRGLI